MTFFAVGSVGLGNELFKSVSIMKTFHMIFVGAW